MNKAKRRLNRLKKEQSAEFDAMLKRAQEAKPVDMDPEQAAEESRSCGELVMTKRNMTTRTPLTTSNATERIIMARGYDLAGQAIHYDLKGEPGTDGGMITCSGSTRTTFLQGDDWSLVNTEVDAIWKQVRWKKIGTTKAQKLQDELLSNYFEA